MKNSLKRLTVFEKGHTNFLKDRKNHALLVVFLFVCNKNTLKLQVYHWKLSSIFRLSLFSLYWNLFLMLHYNDIRYIYLHIGCNRSTVCILIHR